MGNPYDHLEAIRSDIRDEIKRRIGQRDSYSVQLTVAVGALAGAAFARVELERALLAAPLVSIYFTVLQGFWRPLLALGVVYLSGCVWITLWAQDRSRA